MKILVTGSSGFIGSNLTEELISIGHEVVGTDRRMRPADPARFVPLDLAAAECLPELRKWTSWSDAVIHLAGEGGVRNREPGIAARRRRNIVEAARRLLAAAPPGRHLVAVSSSSVYGGAPVRAGRVVACREGQNLAPRGGYARCKRVMETLFQRSGRPVTIVRPFTVIGPRQRPDMALSSWLEAVRVGKPVRVFGALERTRDVTDVRGVCAALARIAETQALGVFNLGSGRGRTLREMTEAVFAALGAEAPVIVERSAPQEAAHTLADVSRSRRTLGVDLTTDLTAAVSRQAAARPLLKEAV